MKTLLTILLATFGLICCKTVKETSWQKENRKLLQSFLADLKNQTDNKIIYDKYIYVNPSQADSVKDKLMPEPERQKIYFEYFDSTRIQLKSNKYDLLLIRDALKKFPKDSLYDTYYDGQDSITYIVHFPSRDLYALVYQNKIISIYPQAQDGKIIWWY